MAATQGLTLPKDAIFANFIGKGWISLFSLLLVPVYIRLLGVEAFGLVGVFNILQGVAPLFDCGLSTTLNRQLAQGPVSADGHRVSSDLARTLETLYWALSAFFGAIVVSISGAVARHWVEVKDLSTGDVQTAVALMGVTLVFQSPIVLYTNGLLGLHRQVLGNAINAIWHTLRLGGGVVVIWLVSRSVEAFFVWQLITAVCASGLAAGIFWRCMHSAPRFRLYRWSDMRLVWRFAAGMSGISVTALVLTQLDKVLLSKLLSLEQFAYYSVAVTVSTGLATLGQPIYSAVFPRLSERAAGGDKHGVAILYHQGSQLQALVTLPIACVLALFSQDVLRVWTGNVELSKMAGSIQSMLVSGTALNNLMVLPYAVQLAHGLTRLSFNMNAAAILILGPAIVLATIWYGAIGAASVWLTLNVAYVVVYVKLMHKTILPGEQYQWYGKDTGLPLAGSVLASTVAKIFIPPGGTRLVRGGMLASAWLISQLVSAWSVWWWGCRGSRGNV